MSAAVARLCTEDLYLAIAADRGSEKAWAALEVSYRRRLVGLGRKRGLRREAAESEASALLADLALPPARATAANPTAVGAGLPPLAPAAREAELALGTFPAEERAVLEGSAATVQAVQERLGERRAPLRALHFAAHAFVNSERSERGGIVLASGEMLSVDLVQRLRIGADLSVLSCCDTARGTPTEGEGQRGLVRAFLVAGSDRVVASCWRVNDATTPDFMGAFYTAWQKKGTTVPAALRSAQLRAIKAGGPTAHPAHWATFVAWGLP